MLANPRAVVIAECRAGDESESVLGEPGHSEVALHAAARVQELRVSHRPDATRDTVRAESLQEHRGTGTGDVELGERTLVEQGCTLATGQVLAADRRRPQHAGPPVGACRF